MVTTNAAGLINLMDPDNFVDEMPYDELMQYLKTEPIFWHEQPERPDGGFWVLTRYADVVEVSRHADLFSSSENGAVLTPSPFQTEEERVQSLAMMRMMMLNMDPPDHTKVRSIVNKGFTPRTIGVFKERLEELTHRILDRALEKGEGDFVVDVAAELPLEAIAEIMGVPSSDRDKIFDWSNRLIGGEDPEYQQDDPNAGLLASAELYAYAAELRKQAEGEPDPDRKDIVHKLVHTEVDGHVLDETEFELFFLLLAVAGNETTRNAMSHGMLAFFEHPEQWDLFVKERPLGTAADEIIRWSTPVMHFQRTAMKDVEVGGQQIKAGQRMMIVYSTANRDPEVFDDPFAFDITRDPNPHIAFGGGGPHFCLGSHLAKLEIQVMFNAIADRMPDIRPIGESPRLRSQFINGIKHIPVSYTG